MTATSSTARPIACALALIGGLAQSPARAEDPPAPVTGETTGPRSRAAAVEAYGEGDPACLEWRNGCVVCRRHDDGGLACSTAGLACLPEAVVCTVRK